MVRKISNEKVKRIINRTENLTGMFRKTNVRTFCPIAVSLKKVTKLLKK